MAVDADSTMNLLAGEWVAGSPATTDRVLLAMDA
jgi:hypothetical protein